ncbi:tRNA methyltransferase [Sulfolobales archaeon HS-7]|nr:tRNA methyltransferase [Sulfolobales archaeon HS-7]
MGARGIFIAGDEDNALIKKIENVKSMWGGTYFEIDYCENPQRLVIEWKKRGGIVIHLTMYGQRINQVMDIISTIQKPILIVVGSQKVEGWYYYNSDFNISISSQPHSEIAALAIFLDRIYKGEELDIYFQDSKLRIIPQERGKKVVKNE